MSRTRTPHERPIDYRSPPSLGRLLFDMAVRRGTSVSAVITQLICAGMGVDPLLHPTTRAKKSRNGKKIGRPPVDHEIISRNA